VIVFLHIPKTAGSTFNFILENSFGIRACHSNHTRKKVFEQADLDFARKVFPGLRSVSGHNLVDPLRLKAPEAYFVTFLREPIARVLSRYVDSVLKGGNRLGFEESLRTEDAMQNVQTRLIAGEANLDKAKHSLEKHDFVGLTEVFDLSLHVLARLCPHKLNLRYKRRRVTPENELRKKLQNDTRLMELARDYNKLDLELYTFARQELFPKLCARAGYSPSDRVPSYEHYTSEAQPMFLLFSAYNMLFYRQLYKLRNPRRGVDESTRH